MTKGDGIISYLDISGILINLVSIRTGYSIGGFDAGKIEGDFLTLGVGKENELFHAIGRGILNIENLPVYRDATGPIGTPTSDEERTKTFPPDTTQILIIINGYSGENGVENAIKLTTDLLTRYAYACDIETDYVPDSSSSFSGNGCCGSYFLCPLP